jgi:hypothetical protein
MFDAMNEPLRDRGEPFEAGVPLLLDDVVGDTAPPPPTDAD